MCEIPPKYPRGFLLLLLHFVYIQESNTVRVRYALVFLCCLARGPNFSVTLEFGMMDISRSWSMLVKWLQVFFLTAILWLPASVLINNSHLE